MRLGILCGLVAVIVILDQAMVRLAEQSIGEVDVSNGLISLPLPNSENLRKDTTRTCQNSSIYLFYRYQFCFQPYTSGETESDNGWHLVYHKPKPWLSVLMPARSSDDFYFEELVQGDYILFVNTDGQLILGDQR